jgi:sugar phosphate isomerase/epimerase
MSWQDLVTDDDEKRNDRIKTIERYIEAAGRLSIPILNVFTGPMSWDPKSEKVGRDISEARAWSVVVESFSSIEKVAQKNNVIVTVEGVFGMLVHDYYSMREFLSYFDSSKHIGVNLDPSHLVLYGNDPAWAVTRLAERVKHVHVKDAAGRAGVLGEDFIFPFLGDGLVDWNAFFDALRRVNYSGYLSLEFENDAYLRNECDGNWALAAKKSMARLKKLLQIC